MNERDRAELRLLEQQLERMRGMLGAYSALFFRQITRWGIVCVALIDMGSARLRHGLARLERAA